MTPQGPDEPLSPAPSPEARFLALEQSVQRLEARLAALEQGVAPAPVPRVDPVETRAPAPVEPTPAPASGGLMGLAGIAFLVLGGAFFIRAITDSGMVPQGVGVGLGLLYACVWMILADRSRTDSGAALFSILALAIVHPLLWESTTKFHALAPQAAAVLLLLGSGLLMAVAWRKSLHKVAWTITLASLVLGLSLMFSTKAIEAYTAVFLAFGGGTLWLTYGRRWHGLRWPAALFADWSVIILTVFVASPNEAPEGFRAISPSLALLLSLGLVVLYLGSFVLRILRRERSLTTFEIAQSVAVLIAGFGGAARVAHVLGSGVGPFGVGALVVALACYGLSFALVEKHQEGGTNFVYFTSLALIFMLVGSPMILPRTALALTYGGFGILAAGLGIRFGKTILVAHSAIYLSVAALVAGTLGSALRAFGGTAAPPFPPMALEAMGILACLVGTHLFQVLQKDHAALPWTRRLPSFAVGTWAVLGLGAFVVALGVLAIPRTAADPGALAALRTAILAVTTVLLAVAARKFPSSEIGWLVHPVLGVTGLKFLAEDLPKGRPLTLFLAFTCYGIALLAAPRMLRGRPLTAR